MKPKKRIVLTSRDHDVFKFLFEQRVASYGQIAKRLFPKTKFQAIYCRLTKLSEVGFISKIGIDNGHRLLTVYTLQEPGLKIVSKGYRFAITKPLFKSESILHDVGLIDIRERILKTSMVVEYLPENVLQACGDFQENEKFRPFVNLNSDAAISIKTSAGQFNVALEYEASIKEASRYAKKLTDYYFDPQVAGVFYVCENASIENLIRRIDIEVGSKFEPKIYTCLKENILNDCNSLVFRNRKNDRFVWK